MNDTPSGLQRLKPATDRGVPEGMEAEKPDSIKTDHSNQQIDDNKDVIYVNDNVRARGHASTDEVHIKRAWSLRDLFKRSTESMPNTPPHVVNQ